MGTLVSEVQRSLVLSLDWEAREPTLCSPAMMRKKESTKRKLETASEVQSGLRCFLSREMPLPFGYTPTAFRPRGDGIRTRISMLVSFAERAQSVKDLGFEPRELVGTTEWALTGPRCNAERVCARFTFWWAAIAQYPSMASPRLLGQKRRCHFSTNETSCQVVTTTPPGET
jgi:hypothetical protein